MAYCQKKLKNKNSSPLFRLIAGRVCSIVQMPSSKRKIKPAVLRHKTIKMRIFIAITCDISSTKHPEKFCF